MATMRPESLRSLAVAILTLQCVLTGTLAALDEAGLAVLEVFTDAHSTMLGQSSWRVSHTASAEQTFQEPIPFSTACSVKVDQIVSARTGNPGESDSYTRFVDVLNLENGVRFTFTIEVSNVGVDPDAADDHWVRFSSISPAELADDLGIPEGRWGRVGSVGPNFRGAVLSIVGMNNVTSAFGGSELGPEVIVAAEEREGETIDGVETRVFFTRVMLNQSSFAAFLTAVPATASFEVLEATLETVTWIDADSLVYVKQEVASDTKGEGFAQVLSMTSLFFDYNMPLQVPDSTTTLDEAADAIAG